jgi:hypothetical protein
MGSGVVFYTILFAGLAVLLVVAGVTVVSRNRRTLEADKRDEAAAHERRRQDKAARSQSRKNRRKRR